MRLTVADAWLALRMALWVLALPLLKFVLPLPTLVRLMRVGAIRREPGPGSVERIAALARLVGHARVIRGEDNCLERSLLLYRFLSAAHARPRLVVGARSRDGAVLGHAWVTVGGQPVGEPAAGLGEFTPIVVFGDDGKPSIGV